MFQQALNIRDFLNQAQTLPVIDVRTPAEFEHAHIPGAVNLPLFNNEERSVIGTLYLKKGTSEAIMKGLEFIGPKMKELAETGYIIAPEREALMHCWRGGMRSNSMAWLMNTVGIKTYTLEGGYKSYRRYTSECFRTPLRMVVLGGMTGSGKTEVLRELKLKGEQVIDLEQLAAHKGSVFGGIGMPQQPSTEQFENDLFSGIMKLNTDRPVYIEDESLAIGKVFLPRSFYDQMSASAFIQLLVPFEKRIQNLLMEYTSGTVNELEEAVMRIERRIGLENTAKAVQMIRSCNMAGAAEIILKYYDKIYARSMTMHKRKSLFEISINTEDPVRIAEIIISNNQKWN